MKKLWIGLAAAICAAAVTTGTVFIPSGGGGGTDIANIWVNTSAGGSPSRSGTKIAYDATHAYGTLSAAWTAAQGGDTILVKGGTYSSGFSASGSKTSTVTISPATGENPWFAGTGSFSGATNMLVTDSRPNRSDGLTMGMMDIGSSSSNIAFNNIDLWCQNSSPWYIVTGPTGSQCSARISISGLTNFTMTGGSVGPVADCFNSPCNAQNVNTIGLCSSNAACSNIEFDNVIFHDAYRLDDNTAHSSMWIIFQGDNLTFKNDQFIGCYGCNTGNIFFGQSGSSATPDHLTFIGNVIGPAEAGGQAWEMGYRSPTTAPTVVFKYNTVDGAAFLSQSAPSGAISYSNTTWVGNIVTYMPGFFSFTCNSAVEGNNVFGSPDSGTSALNCSSKDTPDVALVNSDYFVSAGGSSYDYHLKSTAPARNVGGTACSGLTDYDGDTRPISTCDSGADERN